MVSTVLLTTHATNGLYAIAVPSDLAQPILDSYATSTHADYAEQSPPDALLFILPLLIVLSTFLFVLLLFLVCIIFIRRRRGIILRDSDGPIDMAREELYEGDGGFEGVESRWLEGVSDPVRRSYLRAKGPFYPHTLIRPVHPPPLRLSTTVSP